MNSTATQAAPETVSELLEDILRRYRSTRPPTDLFRTIQVPDRGIASDELTEIVSEHLLEKPIGWLKKASAYDIVEMLLEIQETF